MSGGSASLVSDQNSNLPDNNHYTGCASDGQGNVYVVSMFTGLFPNPGTGSILKVDANGTVSTVASDLFFPEQACGRA